MVASRLPEPTVVPERILLSGSERLVVAPRLPERSPAPDPTWLFGSERVVVAVEPLAAGALVEPSSELLPTTAPVTPPTTPSTTPTAAPTGPLGSF